MSRVQFHEPAPAQSDGYADTAAKIVNDAINDAITQLEKHFAEELGLTLSKDNFSEQEKAEREASSEKEEYDRTKTPLLIDSDAPKPDISDIEWMTIDKFGKELAETKIDEFIKSVSVTNCVDSVVGHY